MSLAKRFFSFQGRASRTEYWLVVVPITVLASLFLFYALAGGTDLDRAAANICGTIVFLGGIVPYLAVLIRRCHDRDHSYLYLVGVGVIRIIGTLWLLIELGFLRGTKGENRYGPDPILAN
jgi:uncharacterized membrane protein YhaH (DUF805 family)